MSLPSNMAFRSPALRSFTKKVRKAATPTNNLYVPSNTPMPELNMSYVQNRNESSHNALNWMVTGRTEEKPLTNKQTIARIEVARKMASGKPVSFQEKINAGIVTLPKPKGPKPQRGGKKRKTRRNCRK